MIKLATLTSLALLLSAAFALAEPMTSGRPAAALKDNQCQEVWTTAATKNGMLSKNHAIRHIVNFKLTDTDHDEQISKGDAIRAEFRLNPRADRTLHPHSIIGGPTNVRFCIELENRCMGNHTVGSNIATLD